MIPSPLDPPSPLLADAIDQARVDDPVTTIENLIVIANVLREGTATKELRLSAERDGRFAQLERDHLLTIINEAYVAKEAIDSIATMRLAARSVFCAIGRTVIQNWPEIESRRRIFERDFPTHVFADLAASDTHGDGPPSFRRTSIDDAVGIYTYCVFESDVEFATQAGTNIRPELARLFTGAQLQFFALYDHFRSGTLDLDYGGPVAPTNDFDDGDGLLL